MVSDDRIGDYTHRAEDFLRRAFAPSFSVHAEESAVFRSQAVFMTSTIEHIDVGAQISVAAPRPASRPSSRRLR